MVHPHSMSWGLSSNWSGWSGPAEGPVRVVAYVRGGFAFDLSELRDKLERRAQGKMWDKAW